MAKHKLLSHEETMELVKQAQAGSEEAVETLVECNTRLVWSMVQRFKNRGFDPEDLFQIGAIGLMKAIQKFDTSFDVRFTTYAVPMIIGEIQRFIRDDGAVKVSRGIKEIAQKIRLGSLIDKTPEEISKELEVDSLELIKVAIEYIKKGTVRSIDETVYENDGDPITVQDQLQGDVNGDKWLDHLALRAAMDQLSEREKGILRMRYFQDMTQTEVANVLDISQVQVSRLEKAIIKKMQGLLGTQEEEKGMARGDRAKAIELLRDTEMTYKEIEEESGVPWGTVGALAKDHRPKEVRDKLKRSNTKEKNASRKRDTAPVEVSFDMPKSRNIQDEPVVTPVINHPAFMGERDLAKATASQHLFIDGDEIVVARAGTLEEMYRVKDTTSVKAPKPVIVMAGTKTDSLDVSKSHASILPQSEEVKHSSSTFSLSVRSKGKAVTKEEAISNLNRAIDMLKMVPGETVSYLVEVTD